MSSVTISSFNKQVEIFPNLSKSLTITDAQSLERIIPLQHLNLFHDNEFVEFLTHIDNFQFKTIETEHEKVKEDFFNHFHEKNVQALGPAYLIRHLLVCRQTENVANRAIALLRQLIQEYKKTDKSDLKVTHLSQEELKILNETGFWEKLSNLPSYAKTFKCCPKVEEEIKKESRAEAQAYKSGLDMMLHQDAFQTLLDQNEKLALVFDRLKGMEAIKQLDHTSKEQKIAKTHANKDLETILDTLDVLNVLHSKISQELNTSESEEALDPAMEKGLACSRIETEIEGYLHIGLLLRSVCKTLSISIFSQSHLKDLNKPNSSSPILFKDLKKQNKKSIILKRGIVFCILEKYHPYLSKELVPVIQKITQISENCWIDVEKIRAAIGEKEKNQKTIADQK